MYRCTEKIISPKEIIGYDIKDETSDDYYPYIPLESRESKGGCDQ